MTDIRLDLPSDIVYVAGYVNDVQTVFRQDNIIRNRWRAYVEAAEDSMYHIILEMHDEAGNVGHFETTVEYILPGFVYDRTRADVDRVYELRGIGWNNMTKAQRKEWTDGLKGCLNRSDLKRIENAISVIAQLLQIGMQTNRDNLPELPDTLYFQTLLKNVSTLRETGYILRTTPELPGLPLNTYEKINHIEHILHDIYWNFNENNSNSTYCGNEIYAGDEIASL